MKLTTVLGCVNNNPNYYLFIPKQILFWNKFDIKFITIFIGNELPHELKDYSDNIILWTKNADIHSAFVAQNMRLYYPALINLPDDELVMITDMDMLPTNKEYYTNDLENFNINDFINYNSQLDTKEKEIFMCYNAAHPKTWGKIFNINSEIDIEKTLYNTYNNDYDGCPGSEHWSIDQKIFYAKAIIHPNFKFLNKIPKRLEVDVCIEHIKNNDENFICKYDDAHMHRNYLNNLQNILNIEKQIFSI